MTDVFDALADPNRRFVLEALSQRDTATATELAAEMPVTDHPVSSAAGLRKTGSENMAPMAMQPSRPPAATITQR